MIKRRVSAKQRLKLVEDALNTLRNTHVVNIDNYIMFEEAVAHALYSKLQPEEKDTQDE